MLVEEFPNFNIRMFLRLGKNTGVSVIVQLAVE